VEYNVRYGKSLTKKKYDDQQLLHPLGAIAPPSTAESSFRSLDKIVAPFLAMTEVCYWCRSQCDPQVCVRSDAQYDQA
jgi:hypothetical protein